MPKTQSKISDYGVVVQGPWLESITDKSLASVSLVFPDSEKVFSTWSGLSSERIYFAQNLGFKVILSDDPGPSRFDLVLPTNIRDHWIGINCNNNRQAKSTLAGLASLTKPYAIKLRSDSAITSLRSISIFTHYREKKTDKYHLLNERILTGMAQEDDPFYISDFYMIGLTKDLYSLWKAHPEQPRTLHELQELSHHELTSLCLVSPESYLWRHFAAQNHALIIRDRGDVTKRNIMLYHELVYNALIIVEPSFSGISSLKYPLLKPGLNSIDFGSWLTKQKK